MRRRLAAMALAVLLLPPIWLASPVGPRRDVGVEITAVVHEAPRTIAGFTRLNLWQLTASNENFGGYSALRVFKGGGVRLFSDRGWLLHIPGLGSPPAAITLRQLYPEVGDLAAWLDIESVTYDLETGRYWVGYEYVHAVHRYRPDGEPDGVVRPDYMRRWGQNAGVEAMVRLVDGRFVLLREGQPDGYLYTGDPVDGVEPVHFRVAYPAGFEPVDMVQVPDGRVLVLLRRLGWHLPPFESLIAIANPDAIDPGEPWPVRPLLRIEALLPRDNYEGLAVVPRTDGAVDLWLLSDDNRSTLQRTLLARLRWDPREGR